MDQTMLLILAENELNQPFLFYSSNLNTGLVYCWHRYYDPKIARWISRDPIGLEGGINTYAYCSGNPVMFADPSGLVKIYLRFRDALYGVSVGGVRLDSIEGKGYHAYLVIEDNNPNSKTYGNKWAISGAPTSHGLNLGQFGLLVSKMGAFVPGSYDFRDGQGNSFKIVDDSSSYDLWKNLLILASDSFIPSVEYDFGPGKYNSNSFLRELLQRAGLELAVRDSVPKGWFGEPIFGHYIPGWSEDPWGSHIWLGAGFVSKEILGLPS